jgi:hypothetical protein
LAFDRDDSGQAMLTIHPGVKAIVILAGPAAMILGFHAVSKSLAPARPYDPRAGAVMLRIYETCAELPKLQRTVRCDEYVSYYEGCAQRRYECSLASSHELLVRLSFDLPPLRLPPAHEITLTRASAP